MRRLFLLVLLASFISVFSADIRWLERDYDFGLFKEIAGPKTGMSRFVNAGLDTIAIISVKPSCGCTSADYTRAPLAPGDTAVVSYTYDPEMRPGKFDKSVRVMLSDGSRHVIRITGNVLGTPESLESLFPVDAGPLRFSESSVVFGEVVKGRSPVGFLNAYVLSQDSVVPALDTPRGLSASPSLAKAGPGDVVTFTLTLDTSEIPDFGPVEFPVFLAGTEYPRMKASAVILPDVTDLKIRQQGKSPLVSISPDIIDLGKVSCGLPLDAAFRISNSGKAPLNILRIYSGAEAVRVVASPSTVKSGKTAEIKLEIDPSRLPAGPQRIPLTILTDDPLSSKKSLVIILNAEC